MSEPFESPENQFEPAPAPQRVSSGKAWLLLLVANVVVFVLMTLGGASLLSPDVPSLLKWGANFGPLTMRGEPWRLFTAMFVHIGLIHIACNMYVLMQIGPMAEGLFGTRRFLILYILAGLGGSIASNCWNPGTVSAGASGAIFGIVGGLIGFMLRRKSQMVQREFKQQINSLLTFVGYNLFLGFTIPHIDNSAHLGGLAAGFALGFLALNPIDATGGRIRAAEWAGLLVIIAALAGGGYAAHGRTLRTPVSGQTRLSLMTEMPVGEATLFYDAQVPRDLAAKLGDELKTIGLGKNKATVTLDKKDAGYELGFVLREGAWNDESHMDFYKKLAHKVSLDLFENKPVDLKFFDKNMVEKKTLNWSE